MKAIAKDVDGKKEFSPTRSDNDSIHRVRDEPEMQLGSLGGVIGNIRSNGGKPSVESIATELSGMSTGGRAPALLALQQTHGNRYVQRVVSGIQAKLVVGQPNDIYEQEADRVADAVMRMPEPDVQRQFELEEEEEDFIQTKPLVNHITPLVQMQVDEEELLQAKNREVATPIVTHDLESQINAIKGGGRPLADSERAYFEPRFGVDFSRVRVHTGAQAAESAQVLNARAYTLGQDVVFGAGQYAPETTSGRRLMAHELTHVVQQTDESCDFRRLKDNTKTIDEIVPNRDIAYRTLSRGRTIQKTPGPCSNVLFYTHLDIPWVRDKYFRDGTALSRADWESQRTRDSDMAGRCMIHESSEIDIPDAPNPTIHVYLIYTHDPCCDCFSGNISWNLNINGNHQTGSRSIGQCHGSVCCDISRTISLTFSVLRYNISGTVTIGGNTHN